MTVTPELRWSLQISSGVFWTLVYIFIIRRGFRDKTYSMPIPALCANLSWEFIFSFLHPHGVPQIYINVTWFAFDVVILYQALKYGKGVLTKELPASACIPIYRGLFYPTLLLTLVVSFCAVLFVTVEFEDWQGKYAAFGQNLMMSVLFVSMLVRRNDVSGQSMYIAIFKLVGTLLPSILFFMTDPSSPLLNFLYLVILTFDLIYVVMLYGKHKRSGINPWKRF